MLASTNTVFSTGIRSFGALMLAMLFERSPIHVQLGRGLLTATVIAYDFFLEMF